MSKWDDLVLLIHSMTKSEKRFFQLQSGLQEGTKDYMDLFALMRKSSDNGAAVKQKYKQLKPGKDHEIARKHLYKGVIKSLIAHPGNQDIETTINKLIQEGRVLFRKGLFSVCFEKLRKAKKLAAFHERFAQFLIIARMELEYFTRREFRDISEQKLIELQTSISETLHHEETINNHSALHEILSFRLINGGPIRTEGEKQNLNDLLFAEMQLMSKPHYDSFGAKKLHLLFQSSYFLMVGDQKSSLGNYYELNELFEQNRHLWADPPIHYIYTLNGILRNLTEIQKYDEIPYFISKLKRLKTDNPSSWIRINQIVQQFELVVFMEKQDFQLALEYVTANQIYWEKFLAYATPFQLANYWFYYSLVHFKAGELRPASRSLNQVLNLEGSIRSNPVYKLCRMLGLIIHFDLGNDKYLEYEIRSFERQLKKRAVLYHSERIIFRLFKKLISNYLISDRKKSIKKAMSDLRKVAEDPFEKRFLKTIYIDDWLQEKIGL